MEQTEKNWKEKIRDIAAEWRFGDFFRNLIAVILGIVITFFGSDLIDYRNTKKDIKESMQLVIGELQYNKEMLEDMVKRIELDRKSAKYLLKNRHKIEEIDKDSLEKYGYAPFQWASYLFTNDAMEMLKSSALIPKIENKKLALQIIQTYGTIKFAQNHYQTYIDVKKSLQQDLDEVPEIKNFNSEEIAETWSFYFNFPEATTLLATTPIIQNSQGYIDIIKVVEETITAITQEYKIKDISYLEDVYIAF